jgi:hypothetical protein
MNKPKLLADRAGRAFGAALLLGRQFIELIKVVPHILIRCPKLRRRCGNLGQLAHHLPYRALMCAVKLMCGQLIVLPPQTVESSARIVRIQKMPHLANGVSNGRLARSIKITHSPLWQCGNLLANGNTKQVLFTGIP